MRSAADRRGLRQRSLGCRKRSTQAGEGPGDRLNRAAGDTAGPADIRRSGPAEFEAQGWNGLFAPKGTPPEIVAKLNARGEDGGGKRRREKALPRFVGRCRRRQTKHTPEVLQQLVTRDVEKYRKLLAKRQALIVVQSEVGDQRGRSCRRSSARPGGTQYPPSEAPPARCPVCEDERQHIPPEGQSWTTLQRLRIRITTDFASTNRASSVIAPRRRFRPIGAARGAGSLYGARQHSLGLHLAVD